MEKTEKLVDTIIKGVQEKKGEEKDQQKSQLNSLQNQVKMGPNPSLQSHCTDSKKTDHCSIADLHNRINMHKGKLEE